MKGLYLNLRTGVLFACLCATFNVNAQESIGLGTDFPNTNSIMDMVTTDKGLLIPRMTTADRTTNLSGLLAADEGLLIYNTTTDEFNYWDGTQWITFPSTAGDADWHIGLGTTSPTLIGDNIWTNGNVGIGTNNPTYALDVRGDILIESGGVEHTIRGGATGSIWLRSNSGIIMQLEDDGIGTTGYFRIKDNSGITNVFRVDHSGLTTIDGNLIFENDAGSAGREISFEGGDPVDIIMNTGNSSASLDIESQGTIDLVLDNDNTNASSEFRIKRNDDGTAAVNTLFIVPEDDAPYVYPYGTNTGETGGIKFRELAVSGGNFVRVRAPDAIGSNFALTLPNTDGSNTELMQTDGNGNLSWVDPSTFMDDDWTRGAGIMFPSNIGDNVGIGKNNPLYKLDVIESGTVDRTVGIEYSGSAADPAALTILEAGTGGGDHHGINLTSTGLHNRTVYGYRFNNLVTGTGDQYGMFLDMTAGNNGKIGLQMYLTGTGGNTGIINEIGGSGTAAQTNIYMNNASSSSGIHYGMELEMTGTGSGTKYGLHSDIRNGNGQHYGLFNDMSGTGTGNNYGVYNGLSGNGAGAWQVGVRNFMNSGAATGTVYGVWSSIIGTTNSPMYGSNVCHKTVRVPEIKYGYSASMTAIWWRNALRSMVASIESRKLFRLLPG